MDSNNDKPKDSLKDKNKKGDEDMVAAEREGHAKRRTNSSQSNSFLKLRHKMQRQMKKNHINYNEILEMTEEAKLDKKIRN